MLSTLVVCVINDNCALGGRDAEVRFSLWDMGSIRNTYRTRTVCLSMCSCIYLNFQTSTYIAFCAIPNVCNVRVINSGW